jgi:hypothetical protein
MGGYITMTTYEQTVALLNQLSIPEKLNLLEQLSTALKHDLEIEAYKQLPWEQFVDLTYGSLANDPIERNQPALSDERDIIE